MCLNFGQSPGLNAGLDGAPFAYVKGMKTKNEKKQSISHIDTIIWGLLMILAAAPALASRGDGLAQLPVIDVTSQRHHARELRKLAGAVNVSMTSNSNAHLANAMLKIVESSLPKSHKPHANLITQTIIEESRHYQMDPLFIMATIQTESGFDPNAKGSHGEVGLMQIRPPTATWVMEQTKRKGRIRLTNPRQNIQIGVAYIAILRKQFTHNPINYVSAYNMGPKTLRSLLGRKQVPRVYRERIYTNYQMMYDRMRRHLVASASFEV